MSQKLEAVLSNSIDKKVLVMTEYYPFFLVGILKDVIDGEAWVEARFGVSAPLKKQVFQIRLDAISAIYAETSDCEIPDVW